MNKRINDLFEAYGIAIGIIIETSGAFLSSIGQSIIDHFQFKPKTSIQSSVKKRAICSIDSTKNTNCTEDIIYSKIVSIKNSN